MEDRELETLENEVLPETPDAINRDIADASSDLQNQTELEYSREQKGTFSFNEYLYKLRLMKLLIPIIVVISVVLLLIIMLFSGGGGKSYDYSLGLSFINGSVGDEELTKYLIEHGFCEEGKDCTSSKAYQFYKNAKEIADSYQEDKNVKINNEVILATISYYRSDEEIYHSADEFGLLADAMVEEYEEETEDGEETGETLYRINMDKYRDYIIGTGSSAYEFGGTSSGGGAGSQSQTKQEFLDWIVPLAKELQKVSGILPSITIAQKAQESGWKKGTSPIQSECHNYFGMKKGSWDGPYKTFRTWEHDKNGNKYYIDADFRCYANDVEGFIGRGDFFWSYSRYADFLICNFNNDWQCAVQAVKAAGYATDVNYVSALTSIINSNQLWQYDNDPDYQWDGTIPDYADYDPYTKQSISNSQGGNGPSNSGEQYYSGGGYLERYRSDLLKGYENAEERFRRKKKIYEEIMNSMNSSTGGGLGFNDFAGFGASLPIKIGSGQKWRDYMTRGYEIGTAECYEDGKPTGKSNCNHFAVDFGNSGVSGDPILAIASGIVVQSTQLSDYGNRIKIGHDINDDGNYDYYSAYNHLDTKLVSVGDSVQSGQQIGTMGETGNAAGVHLHFEMYDANDSLIDPTPTLDGIESGTSEFGGTSGKEFICGLYSDQQLNDLNVQLKTFIRDAGYQTGKGVAAAAKFLSTKVAHLPYFWGGDYLAEGISSNFGCPTKVSASGHKNQTVGSSWPFGFDCGGFVSWAIYNAGFNIGALGSADLGSLGPKISFASGIAEAQPGDLFWRKGHIGIIVDVDRINNQYLVAHESSASSGLKYEVISATSWTTTYVVRMDTWYSSHKR